MVDKDKLNIDPAKLDKIQNLPYEEKKNILLKMPPKIMANFYTNFCDKQQIKDLFDEFIDIYGSVDKQRALGVPKKIKKKYLKKILCLIHSLKKARKSFFVPKIIRDNNFRFPIL